MLELIQHLNFKLGIQTQVGSIWLCLWLGSVASKHFDFCKEASMYISSGHATLPKKSPDMMIQTACIHNFDLCKVFGRMSKF